MRYSLPFYSMNEKDVNRIGWAEELFSDEDKMLLNDRFVDIMVRKDLGDAVRLKGGAYLLDVNNKIVIIGGTFNNPVIHYVMVINADNATFAQEIKEVIFKYEHLKSLRAREASSSISIYETYFGKKLSGDTIVRISDIMHKQPNYMHAYQMGSVLTDILEHSETEAEFLQKMEDLEN